MRQEFDDDDTGFDARDIPMGDDVLVESELQDEIDIRIADDGFGSDLDDEDMEPGADDLASIEDLFDGE